MEGATGMPVSTTRPALRVRRTACGHCVVGGGAVDHAVDAALAGGAKDFSDGLFGREGNVRADTDGQLSAVRQRFDSEDARGAGGAQGGDGEQADGSRAEDGGGFADTKGREAERMQGDGERLVQSGRGRRHFRGDGKKVRDRQVDEFAEEAGMVWVREKADVGADVVVAAQTEFAVIAVERGLERAAVAGDEAGDACAGFHDDAGGLVPKHHGVDVGHAADGALGVGVEIGAADADSLNADLDFAGAGIGDWHIGEAESVGSDEFGGAHGFSLENDNAGSQEKGIGSSKTATRE